MGHKIIFSSSAAFPKETGGSFQSVGPAMENALFP